MAKLSTLNVPVKEGGQTTMQSLELASLKSIVLPVKEGGIITNVEFDLPGGSTPETEQIEITATTSDQVVTPTTGKLIDEVTVHPQVQDDVYVYPVNSKGATVDFGATNNYRKVNAQNVFESGKAEGGAFNIVVGVRTGTLYGYSCVCKDSRGSIVATKTIDATTGQAAFGLNEPGTYTFTVTY